MTGAGVPGAVTEVALRPVAAGDEAFLRAVYASSRADELAALPWTVEQRDAFLAFQFHAQVTDYTRRFPDGEHALVVADGEPVGRVWTNLGGGELRLLDITILTSARGRGVGTVVLRELQRRARDAGVPLRHTVLVTNTAARRLYERLGFVQVDATETHVLMEWIPADRPTGGGGPGLSRCG